MSVAKACSYVAAVYSSCVLFAAGASGPAGWFPREQLMSALVGGWVVIVVIGASGYLRWRALHPIEMPVAPVAVVTAAVRVPDPVLPWLPPLFSPGAPYGNMNVVRGYKCCAWTQALEEASARAAVTAERRVPTPRLAPAPPLVAMPPAGGVAVVGAVCSALVKGSWMPAVVAGETEEVLTVTCSLPDGLTRTLQLRKPVDASRLRL